MTKNKRIILTILLIIALILTSDLVFIYFKENFIAGAAPSFCNINSVIDCDGVARTPYALVFGIPLAIWGTILYLVLLFLTYVDKINEKLNFEILKVFKNPESYIAVLGLFSFCCSMVLASISFFVIKKICILCFATYFIDLAIALVAKTDKFFIKDIKDTILDFIAGAKKYLILFLAVLILGAGFLTYTTKSLVLSPALKEQRDNQEMQKSFLEFQNMKTNIYAIKGNTLGNPDGKIVIYLYSDFMCPFCKVTNTMAHKLAKEEKDIIIYHINFPLDMECNPVIKNMIHPGACMLARYALAAEKQGAYWDMASAIYDNLPFNEDAVLNLADKIGINKEQLKKDAYGEDVISDLDKQIQKAINFGIKGTPTIVIDDIEHRSALPYPKLKELVKQARARHRHDK
jgi:protein-disulfide isomerase/uncharacterized membrane protein